MRFGRVTLTNWKNFKSVAIDLPERAFLIGPNASGKSNFLDAFRFLRDLAVPGGGLQRACEQRGGVSKIRCLSARVPSGLGIAVEVIDDDQHIWQYEIRFTQQTQFPRFMPVVMSEVVRFDDEIVLNRPDTQDQADRQLLSQTALEQIAANQKFRPLADYFASISYLHLVPQMIRDTSGWLRDQNMPDVYGGGFLERIAKTPEGTRRRRLKLIQDVLTIAVPQFRELQLKRDDNTGAPHLEVVYQHWRSNKAGRQDENQFSDGTLRLIGLLWALQEGSGLLLMEEPELSLHKGIVTQLAAFIHRAQMRSKRSPRQVFISTHSVDLLSAEGIDAHELLIFRPSDDGTSVSRGDQIDTVRSLMESGLSAAEAAIPQTESPEFVQLRLIDL